jgi:hypothetical protein
VGIRPGTRRWYQAPRTVAEMVASPLRATLTLHGEWNSERTVSVDDVEVYGVPRNELLRAAAAVGMAPRDLARAAKAVAAAASLAALQGLMDDDGDGSEDEAAHAADQVKDRRHADDGADADADADAARPTLAFALPQTTLAIAHREGTTNAAPAPTAPARLATRLLEVLQHVAPVDALTRVADAVAARAEDPVAALAQAVQQWPAWAMALDMAGPVGIQARVAAALAVWHVGTEKHSHTPVHDNKDRVAHIVALEDALAVVETAVWLTPTAVAAVDTWCLPLARAVGAVAAILLEAPAADTDAVSTLGAARLLARCVHVALGALLGDEADAARDALSALLHHPAAAVRVLAGHAVAAARLLGPAGLITRLARAQGGYAVGPASALPPRSVRGQRRISDGHESNKDTQEEDQGEEEQAMVRQGQDDGDEEEARFWGLAMQPPAPEGPLSGLLSILSLLRSLSGDAGHDDDRPAALAAAVAAAAAGDAARAGAAAGASAAAAAAAAGAPAEPAGGYACDGCGVSPIEGERYHCNVCADYDLCAMCNAVGMHDEHPFTRYDIAAAAVPPSAVAGGSAAVAAAAPAPAQESATAAGSPSVPTPAPAAAVAAAVDRVGRPLPVVTAAQLERWEEALARLSAQGSERDAVPAWTVVDLCVRATLPANLVRSLVAQLATAVAPTGSVRATGTATVLGALHVLLTPAPSAVAVVAAPTVAMAEVVAQTVVEAAEVPAALARLLEGLLRNVHGA